MDIKHKSVPILPTIPCPCKINLTSYFPKESLKTTPVQILSKGQRSYCSDNVNTEGYKTEDNI